MTEDRLRDLLKPQDEEEDRVVSVVARKLDERSLSELCDMIEREISLYRNE